MKYQIENALKNGLSFLYERQLPSGEFSSSKATEINMENASYVKSMFFTTFVLHSLRQIKDIHIDDLKVNEIARKATNYLLNEKEGEGFWRFFGKETYLPLDLDSTCCALSALFVHNIELDYLTIAKDLLNYRNKENIFYTWILDCCLSNLDRVQKNDFDWVVNANVLFFFSLIKMPIPETEDFIRKIVIGKTFDSGSIYYYSPYSFIYCLSRAHEDGGAFNLRPISTDITKYLVDKENFKGRWGNTLENAMATISLINYRYKGNILDGAINNLLQVQRTDGGWPNCAFFTSMSGLFYGSRELTTAISIEALYKYLYGNT